MKKLIAIFALVAGVAGGAFAQTIQPSNLTQVEPGFKSFANDLATSLPYASQIGLDWSSAYIGQFPHFGVGLAGGVVTVPTKGIQEVANALGVGGVLPSELLTPNLGLPIPAAVVEARLGGLFLPFDVGVKFGTIPKSVNLSTFLPSGTSIDFLLYGLEVRTPIVKEGLLIPQISVGAGFNHFSGDIRSTVGQAITVGNISYAGQSNDLSFTAPTLDFNWNSNSLDAKIEVSKTVLFILTPYIGAGLAYGFSSAGGSVQSTLEDNGSPITQSQIDNIDAYYQSTGQTAPSLSPTQSFSTSSPANGFSFWAFGGTSVNLLILKLDVSGMYNILTQKLGVNVGARIQF